ncbi:MAG: hypothetical protein LBS48_05795, partial [Treponema sp.]|nr:hypothetical protein [Treponema sp.]
MKRHGFAWVFLVFGLAVFSLSAQTHVSVPLDDPVYYVLEMAQFRGLCDPLPAVKPYSRAVVLAAINEILSVEEGRFGTFGNTERQILEAAKSKFSRKEAGPDWRNGIYRFETSGKRSGLRFSGDFGINFDITGSGGYYLEDGDKHVGTDSWATFYTNGDIGESFS